MSNPLRLHRRETPGGPDKAAEKAILAIRTGTSLSNKTVNLSASFRKLLTVTPKPIKMVNKFGNYVISKFNLPTISIATSSLLLMLGIGASGQSPLPGQSNLALNPPGISISKDGETKGDDKKTSTALTPDKDPKGNMVVKPTPIKKIGPPIEQWCSSIELDADGTMHVKGKVGGQPLVTSPSIHDFLETMGLTGATTADIVYRDSRSLEDNQKIYMIIEKNERSVLCIFNLQFADKMTIWGKGVFAPDNSKIFYGYDGAIYIGPDGGVYGGTPTHELIIESGETGRKMTIVTNDIIGGKASNLIRAERGKEGEWYWVQDDIMKNSKNEPVRMYFRLLETNYNSQGKWNIRWEREFKKPNEPAPLTMR